MPPVAEALAPAPLAPRAALPNSSDALSITLFNHYNTPNLTVSGGRVNCPNPTVAFTGSQLPLVVGYTLADSYVPGKAWHGREPNDPVLQGFFAREGKVNFDVDKEAKEVEWVMFQVGDNGGAVRYTEMMQVQLGSKGVDGCSRPAHTETQEDVVIGFGIFFGVLILFFSFYSLAPPFPNKINAERPTGDATTRRPEAAGSRAQPLADTPVAANFYDATTETAEVERLAPLPAQNGEQDIAELPVEGGEEPPKYESNGKPNLSGH